MAVNTYLKNVNTGETLTGRVRLETAPEVTVITGTMYSGGLFTQVIGRPANVYTATAYLDRENRDRLRSAHAEGELLEISVAEGLFYGRITERRESARMAAGLYEVSLKLAGELP